MNELKVQPSFKILLPLLAAIIAISPLAIDMYLPAMPILAKALNTDISMVQNTLSIYLLGYALGLLFFGPLADQYSRRKLVFIGILGFSFISLVLPFVDTIEQFLSLRFVQAFISSAATVVVPGTIREYYGKNTAKGLSYVSMIMMLAPMIAPSIGSALLVLHSWQLIFFFLAGYSLLVLLFAIRYLPERKPQLDKNISFLGRYKIVLSCQQARFDLITSMVVSLAFFAYITAIPFVYLTVFSVSEMMFSVLFALNVLGLITAHFINTRFVVKKGSRVMLRYGLAVAVVSSLALVLVNFWQLPIIYTVLTVSPLMGSISMIAVNSDALVLNQFTQQSGTATAVIGTLRFGIGALAGPILAWFYDGTALPFSMLMFSAIFIVFLCQLRVKLQSYKVT
ncbi:MAG: multidrug effflux MFS transporter [Colwellia sp.]|nr:multidrug effflux MFS transporter [Colwellia sp.]